MASEISFEPRLNLDDSDAEYVPLLRSGAWADIGSRSDMEDVYVCAENMMNDYGFSGSMEFVTLSIYTNLICLSLTFDMWNRSYSWMW